MAILRSASTSTCPAHQAESDAFDASRWPPPNLARSVAKYGRMQPLKSIQGHSDMRDFWDVQLCKSRVS
eukprot:350905-Chlamydomonas_euryale.AAC.11